MRPAIGTINDNITLDATAPTGTIVINNIAVTHTDTRNVTLRLNADELYQMRFSNDNSSWSNWEAFAASKGWTLTDGDGVKTVYAQFRDEAGNISVTASDNITLDTTAPTGSILINNGGAFTNSQNVDLTVSPSEACQARFSNDNSSWSNWEPISGNNAWILTGGDGVKTVYAQLRDAAGNISTATISDDITLDTAAPSGTILINNGAAATNTPDVTLTLAAGGASGMRFSNDNGSWSNWEPYAAGKAWTLSSGNGVKTVYAQLKDAAGNISTATISDNIVLDTTAPSGTILINNGAATTNTTDVTLTLAAGGASEMRCSNDNGSWSSWEPYTNSKGWTLASGDGVKTVYAQFRDEAGNASESVSDTITLAPALTGSLTINGGAAYTYTPSVNLAITGEGGVTEMRLNNGETGGNWEAFALVKSWNLPAGDGPKMVYLQLKEEGGTVSGTYSDAIVLDATPPVDGVLTATSGGGQVVLNWSGFSDATSGLKTYRLYYSGSGLPGPAGVPVYEGTALTFTHSGLDLTKTHYYRVVAEDHAGNVSSGATAQIGAGKRKYLPFLVPLLLD